MTDTGRTPDLRTGEVIFILSDVRSGSTLLAQLLAAHPRVVSIGEVQWLRAYVDNDRRLYDPPQGLACACGRSFSACDFWQSVQSASALPLRSLQVMPRHLGWQPPGAARALRDRVSRRLASRLATSSMPSLLRAFFDGSRVARDSHALYEAVLRASGAKYVVDTSKNMLRTRFIYDMKPDRVRLIVLRRDHRAIIYAKMKRGRSLRAATVSWATKARQISALAAKATPSGVLTLDYESLCIDTEREIARVTAFLNVESHGSLTSRPSAGVHDIGGSSSKFEAQRRAIRIDEDYLRHLTASELSQIESSVGALAVALGYRRHESSHLAK